MRYGFQSVIAGDKVVLPSKLSFQLRFLLVVKLSVLNQVVDVLVQVGVGQLQFRRAVLVKQRNGGAVLYRLLVDGDVIAEDFLGAFRTDGGSK